MALRDAVSRVQAFVDQIAGDAPRRDPLAAELTTLLVSPPPRPASGTLELPPVPTCHGHECVARAQQEQETRVTFAAWEGRVRAITTQLWALTWGAAGGRDEAGRALFTLCGEIRQAMDINSSRPWERIITYDGRGRVVKAWETSGVLGEIALQLVGLYRQAAGDMAYLGTADLTKAIAEVRHRVSELMTRPLEQPLDPADARRAGVTTRPALDDSHGLTPAMRGENVLGGTIRFSKRST